MDNSFATPFITRHFLCEKSLYAMPSLCFRCSFVSNSLLLPFWNYRIIGGRAKEHRSYMGIERSGLI